MPYLFYIRFRRRVCFSSMHWMNRRMNNVHNCIRNCGILAYSFNLQICYNIIQIGQTEVTNLILHKSSEKEMRNFPFSVQNYCLIWRPFFFHFGLHLLFYSHSNDSASWSSVFPISRLCHLDQLNGHFMPASVPIWELICVSTTSYLHKKQNGGLWIWKMQ